MYLDLHGLNPANIGTLLCCVSSLQCCAVGNQSYELRLQCICLDYSHLFLNLVTGLSKSWVVHIGITSMFEQTTRTAGVWCRKGASEFSIEWWIFERDLERSRGTIRQARIPKMAAEGEGVMNRIESDMHPSKNISNTYEQILNKIETVSEWCYVEEGHDIRICGDRYRSLRILHPVGGKRRVLNDQ